MPSTYEHFVPEYADFGDLSEDVYFPGEIDLSQFGNQTMPFVIKSRYVFNEQWISGKL
jgi:hypothetical protein